MDDQPNDLTNIGDFSFLAVRPGHVLLKHDRCGARAGVARSMVEALMVCIAHKCDNSIPIQVVRKD